MLEEMSRKLEGVHLGFLRQVTGQKANQQRDRTWRSAIVTKVLKEEVTETLGAYIYKRKAVVAEWAELRSILEICYMDTGYKGGGM